MTDPDNPFLPPEPKPPWSMWLLVPLPLLGPPILGIGLVETLPQPLATNGSVLGLLLFPFLAAGIIAFAAMRAQPGGKRLLFVLLAGGNTLLWWLILFVGMLAP
jgi:hypothetical protein